MPLIAFSLILPYDVFLSHVTMSRQQIESLTENIVLLAIFSAFCVTKTDPLISHTAKVAKCMLYANKNVLRLTS